MKRFGTMLTLTVVLILAAGPALACVGKTLHVGVVTHGEDKLLTKMLTILVNERTGTSIKIQEYASFGECFTALEKREIDMILAFTGQAGAEVLARKGAASATEVMEDVKQAFNQRYNLVWLESWGYTDGGRFMKDAGGQPLSTPVAPLVRKDTLKEFPALARLINKMAGRLETSSFAGLLKKAANGDVDKVARDYLKSEKLI